MTDRMKYAESDFRHHTMKIRAMLADVAQHAREDISKIDNPKAQALFETTAEVLSGLVRAYEHAEERAEPAWK